MTQALYQLGLGVGVHLEVVHPDRLHYINTSYPPVKMTQLPQALAHTQILQNLKEANIIILDFHCLY